MDDLLKADVVVVAVVVVADGIVCGVVGIVTFVRVAASLSAISSSFVYKALNNICIRTESPSGRVSVDMISLSVVAMTNRLFGKQSSISVIHDTANAIVCHANIPIVRINQVAFEL